MYDGDTIKILYLKDKSTLDIENISEDNLLKISIRIGGIDTPEIRPSKESKLYELEKKAAKKVKEYVSKLLLNKIMYVKMEKWGKYGGRVIGNIRLEDDKLLSEHLIELGYAKEYKGRAKEDWLEDELLDII